MTAEVFPFPKASDFEQKKPDQVRVLRHARAHRRVINVIGEVENLHDLEPCGGVTFLFEIDYPTNTLTFAVTACHPEENFILKKAADKVTKMFENGCTFTGDYDRELSLVDNAYNIFTDVFNDGLKVRGYKDFTLCAIGGQLDYILQRGAYDPAFINLGMEVRIPTHLRYDFQDRVNAILAEYNEVTGGEKAA